MPSRPLDAETMREVFVYLYRCWLRKHLGEQPDKLGLSATDGALTSKSFSLYYSTEPVTTAIVKDLDSHLTNPLFVFAPSIPDSCLGTTSFNQNSSAPKPFCDIIALVNKHWAWLEKHKERSLSRSESYEKLDGGAFAVWRSKTATRIILQPESGDVYGYVIVRNGPRDYFLRRSKSCKEDGKQLTKGEYKRTEHRQESKTYLNLDLLMDGGETLLLHPVLAGAGYKAFPRQVPDTEYDQI